MRHRSHGMTLIEVLVALVILGTLLVCTIIARGRYLRQSALAQRKLAAVAALDAMLCDWRLGSEPLPDAGVVPTDRRFSWQSRIIERNDAQTIGAKVLSVQVFDLTAQSADVTNDLQPDSPLVSVELLIDSKQVVVNDVRAKDSTGGINAQP
jgi:prepilin-type N-terminal cleavage/methylation domain-containing protein